MLSQPEGTGLIIAKQWVFYGNTMVVSMVIPCPILLSIH
jgi:hypothetical protein